MTGLSILLYSRQEKLRNRYLWFSSSPFSFFLPSSALDCSCDSNVGLWEALCMSCQAEGLSLQPVGWGTCHQCWQKSRCIAGNSGTNPPKHAIGTHTWDVKQPKESLRNPVLFQWTISILSLKKKAFEDGVHRSGSSLGLSGHGKRLQSSSRSLRWTRMPSSGQTQSLPSHFALNISCFPFNTSAFFQLPSVTAELCTGKS